MASVHIRVGHENDLVVPSFRNIERIFLRLIPFFPPTTDPSAQRHDERSDLIAGEHLVEPRLLHIQDLSLERQDRLKFSVTSLLRGSTG